MVRRRLLISGSGVRVPVRPPLYRRKSKHYAPPKCGAFFFMRRGHQMGTTGRRNMSCFMAVRGWCIPPIFGRTWPMVIRAAQTPRRCHNDRPRAAYGAHGRAAHRHNDPVAHHRPPALPPWAARTSPRVRPRKLLPGNLAYIPGWALTTSLATTRPTPTTKPNTN